MYTIEEEKISVIPVDFNVFYNTAKEYKRNIRYSRDYTISESFFEELYLFISNTSKDKIFIDMKNIVSYPTRMFTRLEKYISKIIIYNVENSKIKQMLSEDLESLEWIDGNIAYFEDNEYSVKIMLNDYCKDVRKKETIRIVTGSVNCEKGKAQLLESSGLYSNYYVDVKRLFLNVDEYYYIIFSLAEVINKKMAQIQIDAFVSSSKNGAILANILGGLLDIKEVHLIGVGPKYSMELGDSAECIKKGKKYAYIFDFMCTGTELKIVSALINSKKAYLSYAAGIAKYKKNTTLSGANFVDVLMDTGEMNIDYKLAGEECDLI